MAFMNSNLQPLIKSAKVILRYDNGKKLVVNIDRPQGEVKMEREAVAAPLSMNDMFQRYIPGPTYADINLRGPVGDPEKKDNKVGLDLNDRHVRKMAKRNHQPDEEWTLAGTLISCHCEQCGQKWPCDTRKALNAHPWGEEE